MEITGIAVELATAGTTRFVEPTPAAASPSWPVGTVRVGPIEVEMTATPAGTGVTFSGKVRNPGRSHAVVRRIGFRLSAWPRLVLETGYQSWSPIRRCAPSDVRPSRRLHPLMARGCYHADPDGAGKVVAGDQYLLWTGDSGNGGAACFLDARRHLSTIEAAPGRYAPAGTYAGGPSGDTGPTTDHGSRVGGGYGDVWAWALLDRIVIEPGSEWELDPLWLADGDPGALYSELASLWGAEASARCGRPSAAPPSAPGWCSWYQYWWKVTPADMRHNLSLAHEKGLGLLVLDDGYQSAVGDWLETNARWSEPGATPWELAGEARTAGIQPGIWTAPFFASRKSKVATDHPEWIVRAKRGAFPLPVMYNPVSWGGLIYTLDTTQPAVLDHLRETFSGLVERGYTYHKIDFCYGATMPGRRQGDGTMTRAQALRAGLDAVREGIGEDAYLLGCGCPFGPAVGVVDAMRVSPDVSPWWDPTLLKWPAYPDTAPAAVNAVRASVLRAPLHRRLFANDPDCVLLRPTKTKLSPGQRSVLADTVAGTGGFTVVSDDMARYGEREWAMLDAIRSLGDGLDSPLDIPDPFAKAVTVRSAAAELHIDWGEGTGTPLNAPGWHVDGASPGSAGGTAAPWSRLVAR